MKHKHTPSTTVPPRRVCALLALLVGFLVAAPVGVASAAAPGDRKPSFFGVDAVKSGSPQDPTRAALVNAWKAFYAGDFQEAVKWVVPLCSTNQEQTGDLAAKKAGAEADHLLARCYWAHGSDQGRAKAKEIWAALSTVTGLSANEQRQAVAKALMLDAENRPAEAMALLEGVLKRSWPDTCTAEAAIELARLEVKMKRVAEARNALQFAVGFLEDQAGKKELPAETVAPFIEAAKAAMGRLQYDADPGRELFETAESLRKKSRFLEAAETYKRVMEEFPGTDYAPRSDLHMGHCLLGLGKPVLAFEHWKKFIAVSPSGPWRGQAYVAIADLCLEEGLNLEEAAKYLALAAGSLPAGLKDPASAASWSAAAFDIHFRAGTVAYVQASFAEAARCLEAARAALGKDAPAALTEGLERLLAGARASQAVLPDDVRGAAADKATLALSLGVVCNTCCDFARAERFFSRVLAMQDSGRTPAQAAFAHYGKAVALQGQGRPGEAWAAYASSLKLLPGGSWQDETLYRLATIIETEAEVRFGVRPPASTTDVARQEAERLARAAALVKAKGEALPYWQELIKRYPQSPRCEQAFYNAGVLLAEAERGQEAVGALERLLEKYPQGRWAGEAHLRLVDISLERLFELPAACKHAVTAVAWIENAKPGSTSPDSALPLWALADKGGTLDAGALKALGYAIYIRAGTVAYVQASFAEAARCLEAARAALGKDAPAALTEGLERLLAGARASQAVLPDDVRGAAADKATLALSLGVVCNTCCDFARAERFFDRVLAMQGPSRTPAQAAFAHYGKAVALQGRGRPGEAWAAYASSLKLLPGGSWQDETLYRLATIIETEAEVRFGERPPASAADVVRQEAERLARAAALVKARAEALPHWTELFQRYPQSPRTEAAFYHAAVLLAEAERWKEAVGALERLLEKYPQGRWAGEAYLRLVDISLERLFELPAACKHAATAVAWIENARPGSTLPDSALPLWVLADKGGTLDAGALKALGYTIYIRVGTVAYLDQKYDEAAAMFKAAEPLAPPRGFVVVSGRIPTAMERMIAAAKARKKLTPDEVLKGDPKAKLILQLADIYVQAGQYENAIALCDRVILTKEETPTPLQRSWAYNKKADATYEIPRCKEAKANYLAAVQTRPDAPWAPKALFYAGTITNNFEEDHLKAAEIFKEVVRRYPQSDVADKAAYFVGVMYEWNQKYLEAKGAYEELIKRFPGSRWAQTARSKKLPWIEQQLAAGMRKGRGSSQ